MEISIPKITVIVSVYNGDKYLEQCIQSIINQDFEYIQIVIVDGGSIDESVNIIKKYSDQVNYWVSEPDDGIYDAWNKALKHSTGDWITFIGSDDVFSDNKTISKIVPHLQQAELKKIKYVYGNVDIVNPETLSIIETIGSPWKDIKNKFKSNMNLAHCGSFHHSSLFLKYGPFDTSFKIAGDYEFLLRELKGPKSEAYYISSVKVVKMRSGGISGSLNSRWKMAKEAQRARAKHGFNIISLPIFVWMIRIKVLTLIGFLFGNNASIRIADYYRKIMGKKQRWSN